MRGQLFGFALVAASVTSPACDRSRELDEALRARQAEWTGQLAALRLQETNVMAQLKRVPSPSAKDVQARAAYDATKAIVLNAYQSLADVETAAAEAGQRVDAAIRRGARDAARVLDEEDRQLRSELQRMWEYVRIARREVVVLERGAGAPSVAQEN